jgi:hypothetical protein
MLKYADKATDKRSVPVAKPHAKRMDPRAAVKLANERYPKIIARLAQ